MRLVCRHSDDIDADLTQQRQPRMLGECAWPIRCETRAQGLKCATHVHFTVGSAIASVLAAEVKILLLGVADRPAAIGGHKRLDRLSLVDRYVEVIVLRQCRGVFFAFHNAAYTKAKRQACDYLEQQRSSPGEADRTTQPSPFACH